MRFEPDWVNKEFIEAQRVFVWSYHIIKHNRVFVQVKKYMATQSVRRVEKKVSIGTIVSYQCDFCGTPWCACNEKEILRNGEKG